MSNQRAGKKSKPMGDGNLMKTMLFFKECKEVLNEFGHDDAAFYFEQVEEHMRNCGTLDISKAGNILGV
jgi:hypothetical protein